MIDYDCDYLQRDKDLKCYLFVCGKKTVCDYEKCKQEIGKYNNSILSQKYSLKNFLNNEFRIRFRIEDEMRSFLSKISSDDKCWITDARLDNPEIDFWHRGDRTVLVCEGKRNNKYRFSIGSPDNGFIEYSKIKNVFLED